MNIKVYSLSRSGHHAISFWLAKNVVPAATVKHTHDDGTLTMVEGGEHTLELLENRRLTPSSEPTIIILRDPYNNYASFLELIKNPNYGPFGFIPFLDLWREYAREASGKTWNFSNLIFISYNSWVGSVTYRKLMVEWIESKFKIETKFDDSLFQKMTPYGGYSSFDGSTYKDNASQMKVLDRYRLYENNSEYRRNVDTPEIRSLSEKLFFFYPFPPPKPPTESGMSFYDSLF